MLFIVTYLLLFVFFNYMIIYLIYVIYCYIFIFVCYIVIYIYINCTFCSSTAVNNPNAIVSHGDVDYRQQSAPMADKPVNVDAPGRTTPPTAASTIPLKRRDSTYDLRLDHVLDLPDLSDKY